MEKDNQYEADSLRLASLIESYTDIPKERLYDFVMENTAAEILPCANMFCETDAQRNKLSMLFEFKSLYETVKVSEKNRIYELNSTEKAMDYFKGYYSDLGDKERVAVAFLDSAHNIIAAKTVSTGTVAESHINLREIIKDALFYNAVSVMMAHNHPAGIPRASRADIDTTQHIKKSLNLVEINLLDHIIVARDKAVSMADLGYIDYDCAANEIKSSAIVAAEPGSGYFKADIPKEKAQHKPEKLSIHEKLEIYKQKAALQSKPQNRNADEPTL